MSDIKETLAERKTQHGPFDEHATIELQLRQLMRDYGSHLNSTQEVGLGMILHKIARILNRGHQHSDTWHDIAGYAILVEKSILDE